MNVQKVSKKVSKRRKFNTLLMVASLFLPTALSASVPVLAAQETETKPVANEGIVLPPGPIGETWRKKPPTLPAPRPFAMAKVTEFKLENGLQVELIADHRVPFITIALGIKAGSCYDPLDKNGLADMTADMLTEGTEARKSKEIADQIDFIGGGLKGVTDPDFTLLSGSALSKYSDKLFDLFTDVLLHPTFPEDELSLKKTNLIEELAMKRSEPEFLVEERYHKMLFGEHPYGIVAPSPASVKSLTRTDVQQYHQTHYLPNESVLVVVGDFEEAKIKELIQKQFGAGWKKGTMPVATMPALPKQNGRHIYLVNRPGSVQSNIRLGNIAISKSDPNYFPMILANEVLGGATQARLFLNIREQKGYTYGAYSGLTARRQPGSFTAEAEVRTEVTAPSLEEFLYELDRIRNVKVSDKELKDAKSYLIGSFQLGLETQSGLAQRLLESKLYDLPEDYLRTYSDKVMAVTPDDIRAAARKMIDLNNIVITIVGDADKVQKDLQYFAPVEVYDTSGAMSTDSKKTTTGS
ncbi:MAG TPA: pitrilysin family protein [Oculatellaceae cyanobacterium]